MTSVKGDGKANTRLHIANHLASQSKRILFLGQHKSIRQALQIDVQLDLMLNSQLLFVVCTRKKKQMYFYILI